MCLSTYQKLSPYVLFSCLFFLIYIRVVQMLYFYVFASVFLILCLSNFIYFYLFFTDLSLSFGTQVVFFFSNFLYLFASFGLQIIFCGLSITHGYYLCVRDPSLSLSRYISTLVILLPNHNLNS